MKGELRLAVNHRSKERHPRERGTDEESGSSGRWDGSLCQRSQTASLELWGKSVLLNVEQFLRNMIDLYFQMRYLIEYIAVLAQQNTSPQRTSRFSCTVGGMEGRAADLRPHLEQDNGVNIVTLVSDLSDIKSHCMRSVSALTRLIGK